MQGGPALAAEPTVVQIMLMAALAFAAACSAWSFAPERVARRVGARALLITLAACATAAAAGALRAQARGMPDAPLLYAFCRGAERAGHDAARGAVDVVLRDDGGPLPGGRVPPSFEAVDVGGWVYGGPGDTADPCIVIDGRVLVDQTVEFGDARPDVAAALNDPAAGRSGYRARVSTEGLAPGPHRVGIALLAPDGSYRIAPATATLTIAR